MKKNIYPALGILLAGGSMLLMNEYTELTIFNDYPLLWIIGGMFFGMWIGRLIQKKS
tara:strand:- start:1053 stop:1223 length:171 start_codon:yes stop_codon:yes gene_type:complete